jgi:WD40 repeat protein
MKHTLWKIALLLITIGMMAGSSKAQDTLNPIAFFEAGAGVTALEFSPDGALLLTHREDGSLLSWDIATGQAGDQAMTAATFTAEGMTYADESGIHTPGGDFELANVQTIALSPRGFLAASSTDGLVKVWNTRTGAELTTLDGYVGAADQLAFLPNGRVLISADAESDELRFWDTAATTPGQIIVEGGAPFALSADGFLMAFTSVDNTATVLSVASIMALRGEEPLAILAGHTAPVNNIVLSPDRLRAATASADATVSVWNISRASEDVILQGHTQGVNSAAFNTDASRIISGSDDGTVMVWDAESGEALQTLSGHTAPVQTALFSPDGSMIASADSAGRVIIWGEGDAIELPQVAEVVSNAPEGVAGVRGITVTTLLAGLHPTQRDYCHIQPYESVLAVAKAENGSLLAYAGGGNCEGPVWITPIMIAWMSDTNELAALPIVSVAQPLPLVRINDYEAVCEVATERGSLPDGAVPPFTAYPPAYLPTEVQATLERGLDVLVCHNIVEVAVEHCHTRGPGPNPGGIFSYIYTRLRLDDEVSIVRYDTGEIVAQRTFRGGRPYPCPRGPARGESRGSVPRPSAWMPWTLGVLYDNPELTLRTRVDVPNLYGRDLPDTSSEVIALLKQDTWLNLIGRSSDSDYVLALLPDMTRTWLPVQYLDVGLNTRLVDLPTVSGSASSALIPLPAQD